MTASDGFYEKAFLKNFVIFTGRKDPVRSSCPEVLGKKGVLRNFAKQTGKHLFSGNNSQGTESTKLPLLLNIKCSI